MPHRSRVVLALALLATLAGACRSTGQSPPPPKNEFEAFERAYRRYHEHQMKQARADGVQLSKDDLDPAYRAVFIGPSGVFVDRQHVATLAELDTKRGPIGAAIKANAELLPRIGWIPSVTLDLDAEPASVMATALRLFAGTETTFHRRVDGSELGVSEIVCTTALRDRSELDEDGDEELFLSVLLDSERIWVGVSGIWESYNVPDAPDGRDLARLEAVLRDHKASDFFAQRIDLELAAVDGPSSAVLSALAIACKVGFSDIAVLPREQLAAIPSLSGGREGRRAREDHAAPSSQVLREGREP